MRGKCLFLCLLSGCTFLQVRGPSRPLGPALLPAKSQSNPIPNYPEPSVPSRYRGLQFIGENERRNPEFLSQVEWLDGDKRLLEVVRLELRPERASVTLNEGPRLEAPPADVPFALGGLHRDSSGAFWFGDREAPGIFRYGSDGEIGRFVPSGSALGGEPRLPPHLSPVAAIAPAGSRLVLFAAEPIGREAPWSRVVEWDPGLKLTRAEYFYPLEGTDGEVEGAIWLTKGVALVAERGSDGASRLYRADFLAATDLTGNPGASVPEAIESKHPALKLQRQGLKAAKKTPLFELKGEGVLDGIALIDYQTVAALRHTEKGAVLWLHRIERQKLLPFGAIETPAAVAEMSRPWARPTTEPL